MKKNKSVVLTTIGLMFSLWMAQAQGVGTWRSYFAYHAAVQVVETPHTVYAVYTSSYPTTSTNENIGSLMSYSLEDQRIETYSLEKGLNDVGIRFLRYSAEVKALLIVYTNNNIDIFLGKDNVYNLPDIKNKTDLTINNVEIRGKYAYISVNVGIWVIDMQRKEVQTQYNIGNTKATCEWNGYHYAATVDGVFRASTSKSIVQLRDKNNWEPYSIPGVNDRSITKLAVFQDHLIIDVSDKSVWAISTNGTLRDLFQGMCRQITVGQNQLILAVYNVLYVFSNTFQVSILKLDTDIRSTALSLEGENTYWIAWGNNGLWKIKIKDSGIIGQLAYEDPPLISKLKLNSPLRNLCFDLHFSNNKLLVTGGSRNSNRNNVAGTFMIYENGQWNAITRDTVAPGLAYRDLMSAVVDPRDPHHYFVSSWGEGIYEFQDTTFINQHTYTNSTLESLWGGTSPHGIRTDGMAFDRNNNLYVANVKNGLNVLTPNGKWYSPKDNEFSENKVKLSDSQINHVIITRDGKIWVNIWRDGGDSGGQNIAAIYALDDNGTVDYDGDDKWHVGRLFTDQQGRKVAEKTYLCLAEDQTGTVWAGTDNGLIYFSSAEQMGRNECNRLYSMDEKGEVRYLYDGQKITSIAVDGANRKWIGTQGSGVSCLDQSGNELKATEYHTKNSPILSDNINSIAINPQTGEVFIATDRGLCSFMGEAISGLPDYSDVRVYPNPVNPTRQSRVTITGLMQNSIVKITDLAGNLIHENTSLGGQYSWNCKAWNGELVKAGIYLVFATLPNGSEGVVSKIMVVR